MVKAVCSLDCRLGPVNHDAVELPNSVVPELNLLSCPAEDVADFLTFFHFPASGVFIKMLVKSFFLLVVERLADFSLFRATLWL